MELVQIVNFQYKGKGEIKMSIAVIYGGTRPNGNSEKLTELVIQDIATEKIYLRDVNIQPIIDLRHSKDGFQERNDDYNSIIDRILPHDILYSLLQFIGIACQEQ